jgi:hypothetical protein
VYFKFQQRLNLLTVKDNFAHLANITDAGDLEFEFTYSVSQSQAVKHKALTVRVDVETRHVIRKPLLGKTHRGQLDIKSLVNNIRTAAVDAKTAMHQQQRYLIASRVSDITAQINNDIVAQLRASVPISNIQPLNRPRLALVPVADVKTANDPQPILHRLSNSSVIPNLDLILTGSQTLRPQAIMHDMITRQGLDPTYIFDLAPRIAEAHRTRGGLSNPQKAYELWHDPASQLLNYYLFPPIFNFLPASTEEVADTDLVHVMQTVTTDVVEVTVPVTIPKDRLTLEGAPVTQVYVIFNLIDSVSGLEIDRVTKVVNLTRYVQIYKTPKVAPSVKSAPSEISSRINLEIKQLDPGATGVQIYKKNFWISSTDTDEYKFIGTYDVSSRNQSLLVQVDRPINSPVLYRVIPVGQESIQGFEYSNIVIKPSRYNSIKAVSLMAQQVDTGIQVEVRNLPTSAVAIQFLRWNLTRFDNSPTIIGGDVGFIDNSVREADMLVTIDGDVSYNNIYRYVARIIYDDGHTADYGDATLEFIKPSPGEVNTKIENLVVSHEMTEPNVSFTISTTIVDTDIDVVKQLLENQGMLQFFTNDIFEQRDELKKLIAHMVNRVDLNTGKRENFGILTDPNFNDSVLRKNQSIQSLEYGHRYRYEIWPLLRTPETLFDNFQKTSIDEVTKKSYKWFPAKFLHPYTLSRGVIVTSTGAKLRYAKEPMSYGIIGSISTVEVSFDKDIAKIIDASASNFDRYLNVVTWKILGDVRQIDHFLILKQVHGIRSLLGKSHSEFPHGNCQYLHQISPHDVGSIQYVIIPIYNDYRVGHEVVTNTLLVEAL